MTEKKQGPDKDLCGKGNIEIPAIVSVCVCERGRERMGIYKTMQRHNRRKEINVQALFSFSLITEPRQTCTQIIICMVLSQPCDGNLYISCSTSGLE